VTGKAKLAHSWKITEIADACGVAHRTAQKRITARGVVPDEEGRYIPPAPALRAVLQIDAPTASEKERLDRARAEAQEMKNAEVRGEVAPVVEIARMNGEVIATASARFMAIRTLAPAIRATESDAEGAELLESGCRDALDELARLADVPAEHRRRKRPAGSSHGDLLDGVSSSAEADDERVG
jgi:hypothetical protein